MPYMRCREENVQTSWINEIAVKRENSFNCRRILQPPEVWKIG
jgi:hypothetical protein